MIILATCRMIVDYPSNTTADLVRQMVAPIVKRDNIKNLGQRYDDLAEEYPETADAIAEAAKYAAGPVCTSFLCFLSNLWVSCCSSRAP